MQKVISCDLLHAFVCLYCHFIHRFWRGMYNRFESGLQPRESIIDTVCAVKDHSLSMEEHINLLEKVNNIYQHVFMNREL